MLVDYLTLCSIAASLLVFLAHTNALHKNLIGLRKNFYDFAALALLIA